MGIFFNGQWIERPQAVAKIDASAMTPAALATQGVGFLVGSSTGGAPKVVNFFTSLDSARNTLKGGELLTAVEKAFYPSATPGINGASMVAVVRVDPASRGTLDLYDTTGTPVKVITLSSRDYGSWVNDIYVKVEAGTTQGKKLSIKYGTDYEIVDNIGSDAATFATLTLQDTTGSPVDVVTLTSKFAGAVANDITVTIEDGTVDGKKLTINYGATYEIIDNLGTDVSQVDDLVAWVNTNSAYVTATKLATGNDIFAEIAATNLSGGADDPGGSQVDDIVAWINAYSTYLTATKIATGNDLLANIAYTQLSGGADGSASASDWQAALDALKTEEVNTGTVVTATASIHAMLATHCSDMCAKGKKNRRGIVGGALSETVSARIARREALNSQFLSLVATGVKGYDSDGVETTYAPYIAAAALVGIECGSDIHMPMTYKYLNVTGLENIYSEDELDQLHANGLIALEYVPKKGYRIVDDLTTTTVEAYQHRSVNRIYDYLAVNTTKLVEDLYIGQPGDENAPAAIKSSIVSVILQPALTAGYIHGGTDPDTGVDTPAYRNITITAEATYWYITYEVSATEQIGYGLITIRAKRTNLVLTA